jgi:predicted nucleic acid-binding protein
LRRFVLDCSVALAWYFPDENDTYANSVLDGLEVDRAVTPTVWTLEFLNAFLVAERRGRISAHHTAQCLAEVSVLPVEQVLWEPDGTSGRVMDLGRRLNLSAYDACYLELAMRLGLPIATLDERLKSAAAQAGVDIYHP